ncbi:NF-kappa-B essential modulator-like isoform X2 [Aricia agestis]|uniref:NF-kappa-B essential modulator-like isoform X2 n=1 Tax=Aricia agestis TaxID=91739 RepID=UPI001C20291B|nr:NF-kappa-B essential modulator-like isoform X2 [Aricia agestis]
MTSNQENDDDSFILILGTSPNGTVKCSGTSVNGDAMQKSQIEDAMKNLPEDSSRAFKAQFHLGESPSPASLMVASTLITDDRSTEELQKRFGELLDENVVLKETLKQNNDSMKEQFMLIASCQEDMLKTHKLHREKFDETRELVERLRKENKQMKLDLSKLTEPEKLDQSLNKETGENKAGPSSAVEFVTSPEDDTIYKLTAQLELVEKQRRQLIVENEKLTWQKESLENIVDATSKERDELKGKLNDLELKCHSTDNQHTQEVIKLQFIIDDLQKKIKQNSSVLPKEIQERDRQIQELQGKVAALQAELRNAQMRILDLENVKLEFSRHKSSVSDAVRVYNEHVQELRSKLKNVQTTVFQPVQISMGSESTPDPSYMSNVKLYDRTLKHLADYLNGLVNGLTDGFVQTLATISIVQEVKMDTAIADRVKESLNNIKSTLDKQHSSTASFISNIRGTLSIFEGIFKDYNELLKKKVTNSEPKPASVDQLTSALLARAQEVTLLQAQVAQLTEHKDEAQLLQAQLDLYKADFEAERESREKMASQKDSLQTDLRTAQKKIIELTTQLAEAQKKAATTTVTKTPVTRLSGAVNRPTSTVGTAARGVASATATARPTATAARPAGNSSDNAAFTCPKCFVFRSNDYSKMEEHFGYCLDDF